MDDTIIKKEPSQWNDIIDKRVSTQTIKFHDVISKITFSSNTRDSILKTLISWTKHNWYLRFIQKEEKK